MTWSSPVPTRRRWLLPVALGVAVLMLLLGAAVAIGVWNAKSGPSTSQIDTDPLADLDFVELNGYSLPVSDQAGPRDVSNRLAREFSHDRAGAVLAAVNLLARVSPNNEPAIFSPTLRNQVVGDHAADFAAKVAQQYQDERLQAGVADGEPVESTVDILGYRLEEFSPNSATVSVLSGSSQVRVAFRVDLRWIDGDWKMVAPAGGVWDSAASQVSDESGFTFFRRTPR